MLHMSAYSSAAIDHANVVLANVQQDISVVSANLDHYFSELFRKLDTPLDRDVLTFIAKNGGADKCIQNDDVLKQLLSRTGEKVGENNERALSVQQKGGIEEIRKELQQELLDIEDSLTEHFLRFEKLLDVQKNSLTRISDQLVEHGQFMKGHDAKLDRILSILPGPATKVKDPVGVIYNLCRAEFLINFDSLLRNSNEYGILWYLCSRYILGQAPFLFLQGAKTSVKAKVFVSTLRDHLMNEGSVPGTPQAETMITGSSSGSFLTDEPSTFTSSDIRTRPTYREVDEKDIWVFDFINVAHVQPIVEAMDDDCSGFISVKEANTFALSRPKGWRSVVPYDYKIHSLMYSL